MSDTEKPMDVFSIYSKSSEAVMKLFVDNKWDTDYTFVFEGNSEEAASFVQAMRMYVSRGVRQKLKAMGRDVPDFSFRHVGTEPVEQYKQLVTVRRQLSATEVLSKELPEFVAIDNAIKED